MGLLRLIPFLFLKRQLLSHSNMDSFFIQLASNRPPRLHRLRIILTVPVRRCRSPLLTVSWRPDPFLRSPLTAVARQRWHRNDLPDGFSIMGLAGATTSHTRRGYAGICH